jgi:BirA family biotin operon repressor/biotin-[acetyl-CoA-carboxylase] ligase
MNEGASRVLEALREASGGQRSGESLSDALGVSRAAIWKQVEALRKAGYEIEGAAGEGYTLRGVPDRLYPEELAGSDRRWLGREIHYLEETDSTNRVAFELARGGAAAGTAVIAERQTAGRGRLGRSFFSPEHANLYTSLVLRPDITIAEAPTLILAAGIAVAEAVARTLGASFGEDGRIEIKWPNDVLIDGRKTSGILMEMNAEETRVGFAVLGIGVNLNVSPEEVPDEFRARATSVSAAAASTIDRIAFTRSLYGILEDVLDLHESQGFAALRPRFDAWFRMTGREIEVHGHSGDALTGVVLGIAPDGALRVERKGGAIERVIAGDVSLSGSPR